VEWLHPTDPPKTFKWQSSAEVELIKVSHMIGHLLLYGHRFVLFSLENIDFATVASGRVQMEHTIQCFK